MSFFKKLKKKFNLNLKKKENKRPELIIKTYCSQFKFSKNEFVNCPKNSPEVLQTVSNSFVL